MKEMLGKEEMDKFATLKERFTIFAVCDLLGLEPKRESGTVAIRCFKHEDKHPSLVLLSNTNRFECKSCGIKGDIFDLIQQVKDISLKEAVLFLDPNFYDKKAAQVSEPAKIRPEEYLGKRGINKAMQERFKLTVDSEKVTIPLQNGEKYRYFYQEPRYRHETGINVQLFKTAIGTDKVILTEGELDAIKLYQETGYQVWSGTGGTQTFKDEWVSDFKSFSKIFICYDNDEPGVVGANMVAVKLGRSRCYFVSLPQKTGKDVTDFFKSGNVKEDFDKLLIDAKPMGESLWARFHQETEGESFSVLSGIRGIDDVVKGFRSRGAYVFAGLEKSGKSALLMTVINNMLTCKEKIGYIDTELGGSDFSLRMTANKNNMSYEFVKKERPDLVDEWIRKYESSFFYAGIDSATELKTDGALSFEKIRGKVAEFAERGARVIVVDNITILANIKQNDDWKTLSRCAISLIHDAKERNIIIFFVIHTRPAVSYVETPMGITEILKSEEPEKIFSTPATVIKRPKLADIFGGGASQSQLSGALLVWRPFQKFSAPEMTSLACVIIESLRNGNSAEVRLVFHGDKSLFIEEYYQEEEEPQQAISEQETIFSE